MSHKDPHENTARRQAVAEYLSEGFGDYTVLHEIISDEQHIDVLLFPWGDLNVLASLGMSDLPMTVPEGLSHLRYAELLCFLPADYNLKETPWIFEWLKKTARYPHIHKTFLAPGHTLVNEDDQETLAEGVDFGGILVFPPTLIPPEENLVPVGDAQVCLYALAPVYNEEIAFKLEYGIGPFQSALFASGFVGLFDIDREPFC